MAKNDLLDISVVVPVHNEEGNIEYFYRELKDALNFSRKYEIIFVDDGSRDSSFMILSRIAGEDKNVKVVKLRGNYGQTVAIRAGLDICCGEKIITMDGDGQHNPKYILDFYKKLDVYDVVCNYRKNRQSTSTHIGNFLIRTLFKFPYKDSIGGMKGFRKQVKDEVYLYGNMHRYLPLLARWKGFKVGQQEIILRNRLAGQSHYRPMKAIKGFLDLLTVKFFVSYSTRPSHIFGSAGLASLGIGLASLFYLFVSRIFFGNPVTASLPMFLTGILLTVIGFNFIFFGFLGDMVSYNHLSKNKEKNYILEKIVN